MLSGKQKTPRLTLRRFYNLDENLKILVEFWPAVLRLSELAAISPTALESIPRIPSADEQQSAVAHSYDTVASPTSLGESQMKPHAEEIPVHKCWHTRPLSPDDLK